MTLEQKTKQKMASNLPFNEEKIFETQRTKHIFPLKDKKHKYEVRKISADKFHKVNTERLK